MNYSRGLVKAVRSLYRFALLFDASIWVRWSRERYSYHESTDAACVIYNLLTHFL
jgi:hypothetical protein